MEASPVHHNLKPSAFLLAASLFGLSACSQEPAGTDQQPAPPPQAEIAPTQPPPSEPAAEVEDDASGQAVNSASEPGQADRSVSQIPAEMRGRWGVDEGACRKQVEDRDGVMTVTSNELHFNKLAAKAETITVRSPTRVRVDAMVDEPGRNFTFVTDLVLQDGGNALVREEEGPRQKYIRCPRRSTATD